MQVTGDPAVDAVRAGKRQRAAVDPDAASRGRRHNGFR
jgi:hypothetical protein